MVSEADTIKCDIDRNKPRQLRRLERRLIMQRNPKRGPRPRERVILCDLTLQLLGTYFEIYNTQARTDANAMLVLTAVMYGDLSGHPMTASKVALAVHAPRSSTIERLNTLIKRKIVRRVGTRYYLTDEVAQAPLDNLDEAIHIVVKAVAPLIRMLNDDKCIVCRSVIN
jgi:hypothetical protein